MAMTLKARIHRIMPVESREYNDKTFYNQKVIFNATRYDQFSGEEYPNFPSVDFVGRAIETIQQLSVGDLVEVSFGLDGRFYKDKKTGEERHFTSVKGFKIERIGEQHTGHDANPNAQAGESLPPISKKESVHDAESPEDDGMPF